jgi:hypothetical protein
MNWICKNVFKLIVGLKVLITATVPTYPTTFWLFCSRPRRVLLLFRRLLISARFLISHFLCVTYRNIRQNNLLQFLLDICYKSWLFIFKSTLAHISRMTSPDKGGHLLHLSPRIGDSFSYNMFVCARVILRHQ